MDARAARQGGRKELLSRVLNLHTMSSSSGPGASEPRSALRTGSGRAVAPPSEQAQQQAGALNQLIAAEVAASGGQIAERGSRKRSRLSADVEPEELHDFRKQFGQPRTQSWWVVTKSGNFFLASANGTYQAFDEVVHLPGPSFSGAEDAVWPLTAPMGVVQRVIRAAASGYINNYLVTPLEQMAAAKQLLDAVDIVPEAVQALRLLLDAGIFVEWEGEESATIYALRTPQLYNPISASANRRAAIKTLMGCTDIDKVESSTSITGLAGRSIRVHFGEEFVMREFGGDSDEEDSGVYNSFELPTDA